MQAAIRQHYQDYVTANNIVGWDFSTTLLRGVNLLIVQYILEMFRRQERDSFHPPRPLHALSDNTRRILQLRIRRNFEGHRVQFRQAQTLNLEEARLRARSRNQRARLSAVSTLLQFWLCIYLTLPLIEAEKKKGQLLG